LLAPVFLQLTERFSHVAEQRSGSGILHRAISGISA
jgi:hypothetical protein